MSTSAALSYDRQRKTERLVSGGSSAWVNNRPWAVPVGAAQAVAAGSPGLRQLIEAIAVNTDAPKRGDMPVHEAPIWCGRRVSARTAGLGASELGIQNIGNGDAETRPEPRGDDFIPNGTKY